MTKRIPRELIRELEWEPGKELPKREPSVTPVPTSSYGIDDLLGGEPFDDENLAAALRKAQDYVDEDGFVLTMPELLQAKTAADSNHTYWQKGYDVLTDEYVGPGPDGNPIVVVLHGGGLLTPERIERANEEGLTDTHAAKLDEDEWLDLLEGKLPDGATIPMYTYDDFLHGLTFSLDEYGALFIDEINRGVSRRYGVVLGFEDAKSTQSSIQDREAFLANPLAIARSGGEAMAAAYFDKAQKNGKLGCWHLFGSADPSVTQGYMLFVSNDYTINLGLGGDNNLDNGGRFLGVRDAAEARRARGGRR